MESGRFIRATSTNRTDIREFTFRDVDLGRCRQVLDLGCSYGYFTRGLAGRLHPGARLVGIDLWQECAEHFVNACRESGYSGEFVLSGEDFCRRFADNSFDLVLCSYALYFFPDAIGDIARILRPAGLFITVTHCVPHMPELVQAVKKLLEQRLGSQVGALPLEGLFEAFSSANGRQLLSPWFRDITERRYANSLRITRQSLGELISYLSFKRPKFIPEWVNDGEQFLRTDVAEHFREVLAGQDSFLVTKDDTVFICRNPSAGA